MYVHNTLGPGFLEKVYENALAVALRDIGVVYEQQVPINVFFRGEVVGVYVADILAEGRAILELKAVEKITDIHRAQTMNYLRATGIKLAIIINFANPKLAWERIVM
jgi:GxxExxY protein